MEDEDDGEEVIADEMDDDDAIEIDDDFAMFAGQPHIMFLDESTSNTNNTTDTESNAANSSTQSNAADLLSQVNFTAEQLKSLNEFSLEQHAKVRHISESKIMGYYICLMI